MTSPQLLPVTLWFRLTFVDGVEREEFNHLEDGHVAQEQERPTPKCAEHKTPWSRGKWRKEHAHLTTDLPGRVMAQQKDWTAQ